MTTPKAGTSSGLRDAMTCVVCTELYEPKVKTPLVLPCGHTFCRPCLTDIKKLGRFLCPTCRAGHNDLHVEELTVNYMVFNILPLCDQFECGTCTTHGDDLRYWCADCDTSLCSICLYSGHPQAHTVKLGHTFVKEEKEKLEERIFVFFRNIVQCKKELKKGFTDMNTQLVQLFRKTADLYNTEVTVRNLLGDIRKANSIALVLSYKKVVKELQVKKELVDPDKEKGVKKGHTSGNAQGKKSLLAGCKDQLLSLSIVLEEMKAATSGVCRI